MAENLVNIKPQQTNGAQTDQKQDDLDQVRDILVGALVSRIDSSIAAHEQKQSVKNKALKQDLAEHKKSIDSLDRKMTKLAEDLKEHVKSFKSEISATKRSTTKVENHLDKLATKHANDLEKLDVQLNESLDDLEDIVASYQESVQDQIFENAERLDTSKVERNDLSQMLANIADMIGNEKPGSKK